MGKILAILLVGAGLIAGAGMYYLQVYHFYEDVPATGADDVQLTTQAGGTREALPHGDFQAIDADSSPIRYRACFTTDARPDELSETYAPYPQAEPLNAPVWFDCFDAQAIGEALEDGHAQAFLGQRDIEYGIDRIVAITGDGRGYVWHQINRCGEVVFDGQPAPDDCPEPPKGY
ncbi:DUF6446 family protein [Roseovarius tibetensis]|uniref:DUF6446 family protein n=1 Tax=Roseovarius tibetensis TaxID=2685897 RepID=UPI003D7FD2C9